MNKKMINDAQELSLTLDALRRKYERNTIQAAFEDLGDAVLFLKKELKAAFKKEMSDLLGLLRKCLH